MKKPRAGGGWHAIGYSLSKAKKMGGLRAMWRAMRSRNTCKTCALGMGGQRGGMVNANIQAGKVPTDEQLAKFTSETVAKLKEMVKDAPDAVKQKISTAWAPTWDYYKNCPGRTETKLDFN